MLKVFDIGDKELSFNIYVSEKPEVVLQDIHTKDGIHIVFAINADRICQQLLRNEVLTDINDILSDLDLKNSNEDVIDVGICKGYTNWQLYGSQKPGCEAYAVTKMFNCTFKNDDFELVVRELDDYSLEDFTQMSAQNTKNPKVDVHEHYHLSLIHI